jgi:hypothetical protein
MWLFDVPQVRTFVNVLETPGHDVVRVLLVEFGGSGCCVCSVQLWQTRFIVTDLLAFPFLLVDYSTFSQDRNCGHRHPPRCVPLLLMTSLLLLLLVLTCFADYLLFGGWLQEMELKKSFVISSKRCTD